MGIHHRKNQRTYRENGLGLAIGGGEEAGEMAEGGQKVQTSVTK